MQDDGSFIRVKWPVHEADHSLSCSAEDISAWGFIKSRETETAAFLKLHTIS